jgi:uroporphyrinogen III methyltransferase/synthase
LVGAGPGDPGLLTLRAAEALASADVLLYDALVADPVLEWVPPSCENIFVGKRGGDHAMEQRDIEALMIARARAGLHVVRLKGGDPFVFGRGAEEAEALRGAGVAFTVVPGISSALAGPAYAGIPVTHRDYNASFVVATGHEEPGKTPSLDYRTLADSRRTVVFLMGMARLEEIARSLIDAGLPAATPAAVVADATRPSQRTVTATLETIAAEVRAAKLRAPAIFVAGAVVELRRRIAWFEALPLFGKRVLVTRPRERAGDFGRALAALGAQPAYAPAIEYRQPDDPDAADRVLTELERYRWIALSSQHGVDCLFERLAAGGRDARALGGIRVAAIGPKTAARLRHFGIEADVVPDEFVGEAAALALISAAQRGDRVLVFRAQHSRDAFVQMLRDAGLRADEVAAYRVQPVDDPHYRQKIAEADVLTFASAGTVAAVVALAGGSDAAAAAVRGKICAYIGPIAAEAGRRAGLPVDVVAESYTGAGLVEALADFVLRGER